MANSSSGLYRSQSVDNHHLVVSSVEPERRALYGSLPFVAQFGMHNREKSIRNVLVEANLAIEAQHRPLSLQFDKPDHKDLAKVDVDEIMVTIPMILASMVAIIAQFVQGLNISAMNTAATVVFPGHSNTDWALAVSAFAIGGPAGALVGGFLTNRRGRRGALMIEIWIFLVGGILMTIAQSTLWLIPARFIIGFASGISSVVVPVYLGEIAPPTLRGTLGTCTQFSLVIGILGSDLLAFPLATTSNWRYLFALTPILCILLLSLSPFLLESPRWLLARDEKSVYARVVIKQLRGFRMEEDVEKEADNYLFGASKHKGNRDSAHSSGAYLDLFMDKDVHRLVVSCLVLQMAQQLCGINVVFYYSTSFFKGLIDDPAQGTALVAFINVMATYIALKLMDSTGRRTLILLSSGGMLISTIVMTGSLCAIFPKGGALLSMIAFTSFFAVGLGPIPWLIVAEMFDAKYVATAMSVSCVVNWGCNFLVGISFPFVYGCLGPYVFLPFAAVLAFTFLFTLFYLPETQGRTVAEIQAMVKHIVDVASHDSEDEDGHGFQLLQAGRHPAYSASGFSTPSYSTSGVALSDCGQ
eukprot:CAMPEP_0182417398 /NCGR_PEP_ID=MMETSP1167-20130531/1863_1 /TAXON_ID=2988 /ORGANISM="Mallomonas Sp, Strain CCMP3275" /LENGTH=583 /DNA_ID=CAMNT_0024590937 /DNA_START=313 /DNA_END=2064 /DNA_ORIENTATION=-